MRVVILSSYPLVDNHHYKKIVLNGLAGLGGRIEEAHLVYGRTRFGDYLHEATKTFGLRDSLRKLRRNKTAGGQGSGARAEDPDRGRSVEQVAKGHGIPVRKFGRLKDPECIELIRRIAPDVIHNLSGTYIPREILEIPRLGVVSGHYGLLPQIRGGDTIRWSVLLGVPLAVSHMFLAPAMDMGDIVSVERVPVEPGDTIDDLRHRCQIVNGRGHVRLLSAALDGTIVRVPQAKGEGSYYHRMGRVLREKVDDILARNLYGNR